MNIPPFIQCLLPLLAILGLNSCGQKADQQERKGLAQDIKSMQIKRITDTQLVTTINEWGKQIVKLAEKASKNALTPQRDDQSFNCSEIDKVPALASLRKEYNIQMQLITPADTANAALSTKEKELLQAYIYNFGKNLPIPDNLQSVNDSLYVYNAALKTDSELYKNCFKARNAPLVLWRIVFHKKDVIKKIDMKALKQ